MSVKYTTGEEVQELDSIRWKTNLWWGRGIVDTLPDERGIVKISFWRGSNWPAVAHVSELEFIERYQGMDGKQE